MAWDDFKDSWSKIIFNPIGYAAQHVSVSDAAGDYVKDHSPSKAINPDTETEEGFKVHRQQWIDGCAGSLKSRDVGYSLANARRECSNRFDQDGIASKVQNAIATRAQSEQDSLKAQVDDSMKKEMIIIFLLLLFGVALYLLVS